MQSIGTLTYLRPFVEDFSPGWLAGSTCGLVAGAMALVYIADTISELKLGNGTSVLIFANIASALPSSVGALLAGSAAEDPLNVAIYVGAFLATTMGIIYVQEAERRIPVNYSSRSARLDGCLLQRVLSKLSDAVYDCWKQRQIVSGT